VTSFANIASSALLHSTWQIGLLQQAPRDGFSALLGAFFSLGRLGALWLWQNASHMPWSVDSAIGNKSVAEHRVNGKTLLEENTLHY